MTYYPPNIACLAQGLPRDAWAQPGGTGLRTCRFDGAPAVAVFRMDAGCVCFPDDREQALCMQHVVRATPLGSMDLVEDLTAGHAFASWWFS